jgi:16S rRNA (cytidine1402-2'-O)-methyltransferase
MDYVACEDTRHTQQLCRSLGIDLPASKCIAVHQHNEHEGAQRVASLLQEGCRVAYLSDAGTPGVSDPGAILTHEVQSRGFRVMPIPGVSSITALLSVSGVVEPEHAGFVFVGFLSSKAPMRQSQIQAMGQEGRAHILLEAPHRIVATAKALVNTALEAAGFSLADGLVTWGSFHGWGGNRAGARWGCDRFSCQRRAGWLDSLRAAPSQH